VTTSLSVGFNEVMALGRRLNFKKKNTTNPEESLDVISDTYHAEKEIKSNVKHHK